MRMPSDDEKWQIITSCCADYDGVFFYAVKSTGIYCKPSCKSRLPKRENVAYFCSSFDAQAAGYRACKRCRSDLVEYEPTKEIAMTLKSILDRLFLDRQKVNSAIQNIGLSQRRIDAVFKTHYGMTPKKYVDCLRITAAKERLLHSDDTIVNIAFTVGFGSLSAFYHIFKHETGVTPKQYKKENIKI